MERMHAARSHLGCGHNVLSFGRVVGMKIAKEVR